MTLCVPFTSKLSGFYSLFLDIFTLTIVQYLSCPSIYLHLFKRAGYYTNIVINRKKNHLLFSPHALYVCLFFDSTKREVLWYAANEKKNKQTRLSPLNNVSNSKTNHNQNRFLVAVMVCYSQNN